MHSTQSAPDHSGVTSWLQRQARIQRFAGLTLAASITPKAYDAATRGAVAQALCAAAWQTLPGYFLASILLGGVLTHVFAVTAASYGLSHLALEAVVRLYVMELLPLAAALFVALRAIPATLLRLLRILPTPARQPTGEVVAYFVGNFAAVWVLATVSSVATLVVAYPVLHGATFWAVDAYARVVGQVFSPLAAAGLAIKLLFFSGAVALVPLALLSDTAPLERGAAEVRAIARLLLFLVLIEGCSLALRIN
jgi:phospholipid/cholesterol/gamma-HCH transport system permease protein